MLFIKFSQTKFGFNESVEVKRAHGTGMKLASDAAREDRSAFGPRLYYVVNFMSWEWKEAVI